MKLRIRQIPALFAVLLLPSFPTMAYYCATGGRWLTRDPLPELGANLIYELQTPQSAQDRLNPYCAVLNNHNLVDKLGTACVDVCNMAKALHLDDEYAGGVICCGGKKYACVWTLGPLVTNPKANDIISSCVAEHEFQHFFETQDCPICSFWPTKPNWVNGHGDECKALQQEYDCLQKKYRQGACGADSTCAKQVLDEMFDVLKKRNKACGGGPRKGAATL